LLQTVFKPHPHVEIMDTGVLGLRTESEFGIGPFGGQYGHGPWDPLELVYTTPGRAFLGEKNFGKKQKKKKISCMYMYMYIIIIVNNIVNYLVNSLNL
jgi:hypothetical protein